MLTVGTKSTVERMPPGLNARGKWMADHPALGVRVFSTWHAAMDWANTRTWGIT